MQRRNLLVAQRRAILQEIKALEDLRAAKIAQARLLEQEISLTS